MRLRLHSTSEVGAGVVEFSFQPELSITWLPGQSIKLSLQQSYSSVERRFTITSTTRSGRIKIATRNSDSAFKRRLFSMQVGDEIQGFSIEGSFLDAVGCGPAVLCAQGVGVTPYISLVRSHVEDGTQLNATLIAHSLQDKQAFAEEIQESSYVLQGGCAIVTSSIVSSQDILAVTVKHPDTKVFLSGSSSLVYKLSDELASLGVLREHINSDWFSGDGAKTLD